MCKVASRNRKASYIVGWQLFLISMSAILACGGSVKTSVLARSAEEQPPWLQDASMLCSKNHRCAVSHHWHDDLGSATARARAKAVSALVSEVAVTISGVLELEERISKSPSRTTETTSISHRIAARVKGQLTEAKTAAHYWERAERYTKHGPKPQYRSYVLVSVPTTVLNAMSTEALKAKKRLEDDTLALTKRLELDDDLNEEPIVLLRMIKGLKRRADDLTMRSVLSEALILQIEARIAAKTKVSILKTEITPKGHVQVMLGLTIDGVVPVGCNYEISVTEASETTPNITQNAVSTAGTVSLTYVPSILRKRSVVRIYPQGLYKASKSIELPSIFSLGHLQSRVVFSGYSKRYIGRLVATENPRFSGFMSEAEQSMRSDEPRFLLEFKVRLSPKPSRVTPSLIQIQAQIASQLFYLNGGRVPIGQARGNSVAGMGADERAAAKAVAQEISNVASLLSATVFGENRLRSSIP